MLEDINNTSKINLETEAEKLVKPLEKPKGSKAKLFLGVFGIAIAGILTGYLFSRASGQPVSLGTIGPGEAVKKGMKVGLSDEKTFRDMAEGKLLAGGVDGEGSHHLERPGGPSQNVYLTSSAIDLDQFVDHQVRVWGETFAAQTAAWLMDVGKLEVLE